jgi:hypothetical protein
VRSSSRPATSPAGTSTATTRSAGDRTQAKVTKKRSRRFFAEEAPTACIIELQWVWKGDPPYSRGVTSAAYVFRNDHDAGRAFADQDELVAYTAPLRVLVGQPVDLGNEAELLRGGRLNYPAAGVLWQGRSSASSSPNRRETTSRTSSPKNSKHGSSTRGLHRRQRRPNAVRAQSPLAS